MSDSFSEVSEQGWLSRIGSAIKGVVIGIILFAVAILALFWNEGRAVKRYKTLKEGAGSFISLSSATVDGANDGKLVHVSGSVKTEAPLVDSQLGVEVNSVKLNRTVQMYQWIEKEDNEKKKKLGGGTETVTTYSYKKGWSSSLNNSNDFKEPEGHKNPATMEYESQKFIVDSATLGEFQMSSGLVGQMSKSTPVVLTEVPKSLSGKASLNKGGIYVGEDASKPVVGDYKITYTEVKPADVSVVALQSAQELRSYQTEVGGTIELLEYGTVPGNQMFQAAQASNSKLTWILRLVGFVVMAIGVAMVLSPLAVIADVIPFVGDLVGAGTTLIAILVAAVISPIVIAVAWLFYRPVLSISLLLLATVIVVGIFKVVKSKKEEATPALA
ncbi:MAG: TMEM43 family protein [Lentisphaeria bacterium]|nr:TMEM43 family protein [Lentisphaeria bacterium]